MAILCSPRKTDLQALRSSQKEPKPILLLLSINQHQDSHLGHPLLRLRPCKRTYRSVHLGPMTLSRRRIRAIRITCKLPRKP
ncbi:uncharacterized protein K441DRAFT_289224 [Cenococcum geophilum 1.58]|uniref:uncharacterized protein n=1 Tax=Cenococcum geophilum 1.58 TaxID=794803 RepID=UPI00358E449B|nr:hypothetical protein K441DRAFT_289224 [Cenococcum geophilum 1.58]